jgi:hypothetical protein
LMTVSADKGPLPKPSARTATRQATAAIWVNRFIDIASSFFEIMVSDVIV